MKRIEFKYHPNLYSDEILIHAANTEYTLMQADCKRTKQ